MTGTTKHHLKNLSSSWFFCVANVIVMMWLSQFVVRALGKEVFGIWTLIVSITGYMGLADLGMRNSLGRFINYYLGQDRIDKVNEVFSTTCVFFIALTPLIFIAAYIFGLNFGAWFKDIPVDMSDGIRNAMMVTALNLWLGLFSSAFSLIVTSQERFELFNLTNLGSLAIRGGGTIILIKMGHGILALAGIQAFASLFSLGVFVFAAKRVFPALRPKPSLSSYIIFKELFAYGKWAFISGLAGRLLYFTDLLVIGLFLGPKATTLYSIPLTLINASRDFVGQVTEILAPKTIKLSSRKNLMALQMVLKWGSKFTMFFAIPVFAGLIFFGPKFMVLFWGEKVFSGEDFQASKWVLIILAIPQFFTMAVRIGGSITSGLGHIKFAAVVTLGQAILNFILTLVFVLICGWGIEGVALGTLVPMVIFNVYMIWVLHSWLNASVAKFFKNNISRWLLAIGGVFVYAQGLKVALFELSYNYARLSETWGGFLFVAILYVVGAVGIAWFLGFHDLEREILSQEIWALIPARLKRNIGKKEEK